MESSCHRDRPSPHRKFRIELEEWTVFGNQAEEKQYRLVFGVFQPFTTAQSEHENMAGKNEFLVEDHEEATNQNAVNVISVLRGENQVSGSW